MSPSSKPATIRFYIDADVLGLAKVLIMLRPDGPTPAIPEVSCTGARGPRA